MGTNYYHYDDVTGERRHIGKSSVGWVFLVRVHEDVGIHTLADWQAQWQRPDTHIEDEHGERLTPDEMLRQIVGRSFRRPPTPKELTNLSNNHEVGPKNLMRPRMGGWSGCVGHGAGTWSYIAHEFT